MGGLGRRVRQLRRQRGLTQAELGSPLFTHSYVSQIESGKRDASPRALAHIAGRLGVATDELVTGRPADLAHELGVRITEARRLLSSGKMDEARALYEGAAREAEEWDLPRIEAQASHGIGLCLERSERWDDAIEVYESAEERLGGGSPDVYADLLSARARCLVYQGDIGLAMYLLDRTVRDLEHRGIADALTLVKLYAPLSFTAMQAGVLSRARQAAARALELQVEVDDPFTLAVSHINVARVLLAEGEPDAAQRAQLKAAEMFDQLGLRLEMGRAHLAYGFTRARVVPDEDARRHLERARDIFRDLGAQLDEAQALVELGRLARIAGSNATAVAPLEAAIDIMRMSPHVPELALAHRELGLALFDTPDLAEKHLRDAADLFERADAALETAITYRYLGELAESTSGDGCDHFRAAALAIPTEI